MMRRRINPLTWVIVLPVLLVGGCTAAFSYSDSHHHSALRTAVGEVRVGMTRQDVLRIVGPPYDEARVGPYLVWTYTSMDDLGYAYQITMKYDVVTEVDNSTDP